MSGRIQVSHVIFACVHVQLKAFFSQGKLSLSAKLLSAAVEAEVESKDENMDDIGGCYSRFIQYEDVNVNHEFNKQDLDLQSEIQSPRFCIIGLLNLVPKVRCSMLSKQVQYLMSYTTSFPPVENV